MRAVVFLVLALVLVVALWVRTPPAFARDHRTLCLVAAHGGESLCVRPFGAHGRLDPSAWRRLNRLLRSHRTGSSRPIHPGLIRVITQIARRRRVEVLSAFRVPDEGDQRKSQHHTGRACDLAIPGIAARDVLEMCLAIGRTSSTGCGLYPNAARPFVHVDVRPTSALWVDLGHRHYVRDPWTWLRGSWGER